MLRSLTGQTEGPAGSGPFGGSSRSMGFFQRLFGPEGQPAYGSCTTAAIKIPPLPNENKREVEEPLPPLRGFVVNDPLYRADADA